MGTTKVTLRDMVFFILGGILTLLIGGFVAVKIQQESLKIAAADWLQAHRNEIFNLENECNAKIFAYTGRPGSIMIKFNDRKNGDVDLSRISLWLISNKCPYVILQADE